jgi:P4 family phage/plasmid primase-like protien
LGDALKDGGQMKESAIVGTLPAERNTEETNISEPLDPSSIPDDIEPPDSQSTVPERRKIRDFDDCHNLAQEYLEKHACINGDPTILHWRNAWYRWDADRYVEYADYEVRGKISNFIRSEFDAVARKYSDNKKARRSVTQRRVSDVLHALSGLVSIAASLEPPVRLSRTKPTNRVLVLANGVLDIDAALQSSAKALRAHSPKHFNLHCAAYGYDPAAQCPQFHNFLAKVMEADAERIALLQEICGLALIPDNSFQRFIIVFGEGANGKGVFLEVLTALVGPDNVSHVPMGLFGERFQLANTLGKLINIEADAGQITQKGEAYIKSFTGGDRLQFEMKYKHPVSALPTARLIIGTNTLPEFQDRSSGIWRRMILVPFRVQIPEEERDRDLTNKLKTELPGVLNWALEGLRRLYSQGCFTQPAICRDALSQYRTESNSARLFLSESYASEKLASVECRNVYARYTLYCSLYGYDRLNQGEFGKEIRRVFPDVQKKRETTGDRDYRYHDIAYIGGEEPPVC